MIEILDDNDINRIASQRVREHLHKRFQEIGGIQNPSVEGYFVYVDDFEQLYHRNMLRFVDLPGIEDGILKYNEGVLQYGEIVEVSILFNNEFLLTLVLDDLGEDQKSLVFSSMRETTS